MRFEVTFRNLEPSDALRDRAAKKFAKVHKHLREPVEAHMVLYTQKHRHVADFTVTAAGDVFKLQESTEDMYSTIDTLMARLERTVRRHKEKFIDRTHDGPGKDIDGFAADEDTELVEVAE